MLPSDRGFLNICVMSINLLLFELINFIRGGVKSRNISGVCFMSTARWTIVKKNISVSKKFVFLNGLLNCVKVS